MANTRMRRVFYLSSLISNQRMLDVPVERGFFFFCETTAFYLFILFT
jgi:hypothetical protein